MIEKHIVLEDVDPVIFYGVNNANMQMIKALYPKLRIVARDNIDPDAAMRRILAQKSDEFFKTHSDYIIENNGTTEALAPQVHRILAELGVISK